MDCVRSGDLYASYSFGGNSVGVSRYSDIGSLPHLV